MATTEKEAQIAPSVPQSIMHNTQTLSNLQSLTASIYGAAAGILGLESYSGFLFYFVFTALTTILFYLIRVAPSSLSSSASSASTSSRRTAAAAAPKQQQPGGGGGGGGPLDTSRFFRSNYEFWLGGLFSGLPGYILTWTLFYGMVRA